MTTPSQSWKVYYWDESQDPPAMSSLEVEATAETVFETAFEKLKQDEDTVIAFYGAVPQVKLNVLIVDNIKAGETRGDPSITHPSS